MTRVADVEEWRAIPGFIGYEASSFGRVRSLDRYVVDSNGHRRFRHGRVLSPGSDKLGRQNVQMPGAKTCRVHRLVLEAFIGPCPDGMEACHANDIKSDNRLINLRWDTRAANQKDSVRNGTHSMARKTHCANGHEFTEENTYWHPDRSRRSCRTCSREGWRRSRANRRSRMIRQAMGWNR